MVNLPIMMVGRVYGLCSHDGKKTLDVEVVAGARTGFFRFGISSRYLRITQTGEADAKGGGAEPCNFSVEVHASGLVSLVRGPFRLASGDEHNSLTSVSKECPTAPDTLWAVEEKADTVSSNVYFRQDAMRFGPFLRKYGADGRALFLGSGGGYLRITPGNGGVDTKGGGGQPCQFTISRDGDGIRLQGVVEPRRYLGVSSWGALTGSEVERSRQMFHLEAACPEEQMQLPKIIGHTDFDESVDFTVAERAAFMRDGFIIVRRAIPSSLVDAALGRINAALLVPGSVSTDDDGTQNVCPGAKGSDEVQALLYGTPLWTLAQRLLGRGLVAHCPASQIALRPPNPGVAPLIEGSISPKQWHIDGMGQGKHSPFSLLLGVALSAQTQPNCGNLVAFPGSHHVLQPLLRREVEAGSGMFSDEGGQAQGKPALMGGQQLFLHLGDAVLLHQKVAHRIGVNLSPHIRYQTYFRLKHVDHGKKLEDGSLLDDLWAEFEGLKQDIDMDLES